MTRVLYLILLSLVLMALGCVGVRTVEPMEGIDAIEEPVAILPVIPSNVVLHYTDSELYHEYWAEKTNEILNTLSGGKKDKLLGPKDVYKLLETKDIEYLNSILDQSEIDAEPWESISLGNISRELGVTKIIRVNLEIYYFQTETSRNAGGFRATTSDYGWVDVSMELLKLSPPNLVTTSYGSAQYKREVGLVGFGGYGAGCIIPTHVSLKYKPQAVDEASRQALSELLTTPDLDPTVK